MIRRLALVLALGAVAAIARTSYPDVARYLKMRAM